MRKSAVWKVVVLGLWALPAVAWADFDGRVVRVADGDTVTVLRDHGDRKEQVRVRLSSIDAPERRQAFGTRSREHLAQMVFDQQVRIEEHGTDRYGRVIGVVHIGQVNANQEMVHAGMAWAYRQYLNDSAMLRLETAAKRAGRGLWVDRQAQAPWEFRRSEAARRKAEREAREQAAAAAS